MGDSLVQSGPGVCPGKVCGMWWAMGCCKPESPPKPVRRRKRSKSSSRNVDIERARSRVTAKKKSFVEEEKKEEEPKKEEEEQKEEKKVRRNVLRSMARFVRRKKLPVPEDVEWTELVELMPLPGPHEAEAFENRLMAFHDDELTMLTTKGDSILSYAVFHSDALAVAKILLRLKHNPTAQNRIALTKNSVDLSALDMAQQQRHQRGSSTDIATILDDLQSLPSSDGGVRRRF